MYLNILLWSFGTLTLSLVAFVGVTALRAFSAGDPGQLIGQLGQYQLAEARALYEQGGAARLAASLGRMNSKFSARHYLTDAQGNDLASHESRAYLLPRTPQEALRPFRRGSDALTATKSEDGRYFWIVSRSPPIDLWAQAPYYLLILVAIALLSWILAVNIARPLQEMAQTVHHFGAGDLSARIHTARRDEIGQLGRAFDDMAGRIETLVGAERQLLQDISHELRSPLARLSIATELVKRPDARAKAIAQLEREVDRMGSMIGDLVAVTRAEGDPSAQPLELVELDALVADVSEICEVEAQSKNCTIRLQSNERCDLPGNPELLRRAIENVLRNGIRYSPSGSSLDIALRQDGAEVAIAIRDYGPGVPDVALGRIFSPFYRIDSSRNSGTGGVGLGLAIAQRTVSIHHGKIWAENAAPGLRVVMVFPVREKSITRLPRAV